ncbi:toll/interleukin-1 receptor domain-containing protein [Streptomyces massasporeus]
MKIFLSHSVLDQRIATALQTLFKQVFGDGNIQMEFSSDQDAGGGIPPGDPWLPWIKEHLKDADGTYILLTPNSMNRPWVLWESGAAAGIAMATKKSKRIVPIMFGDIDTPSPFSSLQMIRGDSEEDYGIHKLLGNVNKSLSQPIPKGPFAAAVQKNVPVYLKRVKGALQQQRSEGLLTSVPSAFPAERIAGYWVTCFSFGESSKCHADVAGIAVESQRRLRVLNEPPAPVTEGHPQPFLNEIEAELANRHIMGYWKNVSDTRYFGSVHLAILPGETVMEGYYTSFHDDVTVRMGNWKWVRLDPKSFDIDDFPNVKLKDPHSIQSLMESHHPTDRPIDFHSIVEGG